MNAPINIVVFKWHREGYRSKFNHEHVNTFARMVARHTTVPYNLYCITDDPVGLGTDVQAVEIWPEPVPDYGGGNWPNCFRRLRMFSDEVSEALGPRWIWFDLDCMICGNIDHILTDQADFKIWRPDGGRSLCNGSMVLHRAGARRELWYDFDPDAIGSVEEFQAQTSHLGSDQAWIARHLRPEDEFFEAKDGVYAFRSLRNQHRERHLGKIAKASPRIPPRERVLSPFARKMLERDMARRAAKADTREQERLATDLPPSACVVFWPGQWHPWDEAVQRVYPWVQRHYR